MRLHHFVQSLTMKHQQTLCASSSLIGNTKTLSLPLTAWTTRQLKATVKTAGKPPFTSLWKLQI